MRSPRDWAAPLIAASNCLAAAAEASDASDVVSTCITTSGIVMALHEVRTNCAAWYDPIMEYRFPPTRAEFKR